MADRDGAARRLAAWFGADDDWERVPRDRARALRVDTWVALGFLVVGSLGIELMRSLDGLGQGPGMPWSPHALVAAGTLPLALRRRWPLVIAGLLSLHMLITGLVFPAVMGSLTMQVVYFFALFTGVAWARDRRAMLVVVAFVVVVMFGWLVIQFGVGSGIEHLLAESGEPPRRQGLFSPATAYVGYILLVNVIYFGGAVLAGQTAWRAAQQREQLEAQAATIAAQAEELRDQAVIEERLRIARELHDVVAHHVSVIGVQAAAARRLLRRDPDVAEASLRTIEASSRDAVGQMRELLGTLRSGAAGHDHRTPEPSLRDVPALVEHARTSGLDASLDIVEEQPDALGAVPAPISLSLYRTVQEALANIRRHSTARRASVTVRVDRRPEPGFAHGWAEVEVVDDGRPRTGTSGTGLGLLGVRERLAAHGGTGEIGPRVTGGYRVRVRMPLTQEPT